MRKRRHFSKGRRFASFLLVCTLVVCTLSACGGGKEGEDATPEPEATVSPEVTEGTDANADSEQATNAVKHTTLKDAYADRFSFGVAINRWQLEDEEILNLIKTHFNSITLENEMKPSSLLDEEASYNSKDGMPKIKTDNLAKILELAKQNGFKVRGHVLVWHNQTPDWFFRKGFEWFEDYEDKEVIFQRLESYIKQVLEFCQENYPGVVYAWDVLNEAVADGGGYREESPWYESTGEEFIGKAFEYARKYATEDVKLFYNDYNEYNITKREYIYKIVKELKEKDLIDGVGMQMHIDMGNPSINDIEDAIRRYSDIGGLEIQLTEIDMHNPSDDDVAYLQQAIRYQLLFEMLLKVQDEGAANITNVTFWGLTDDNTWLSGFREEESYPLLFDGDYQPKPAFDYILKVINGE